MNRKTRRINKILGLLLIAASAAMLLTGCVVDGKIIGLSDYYYDDSENYTAGDADLSEKVESIEIDWMVGSVKMLTNDAETVSFSEKSNSEIAENMQLRYWLDGTTLRIKYCACGKWDLSDLKKDLTISLPKTLVLDELKVNTLSAAVTVSDCAVTESAKFNTVSGKVDVELSKSLDEFEGNSTSGEFTVTAPSISRFDVDAVSGAVSLSVQKEPDRLDIDLTSGNVKLVLPKNASFILDYDTISGKLSSDLKYNKSKLKYVFGDGKGEYEIDTVSGNVVISENAQEE